MATFLALTAALTVVTALAPPRAWGGPAAGSVGGDETGSASVAGLVASSAGTTGASLRPLVTAQARRSVPVVDATVADVFFVPHQDDEALTFGTAIYLARRAGHKVLVVNYTDGASTGVCAPGPDELCHAADEYQNLPVETFVRDRTAELINSLGSLGVPSYDVITGDVVPALDGAPALRRVRDGHTTTAFAATMIGYYAEAYPHAVLHTMSWIDNHPDHRLPAMALRTDVQQGLVSADRARFSMFRIYWQTDYPSAVETWIPSRRDLLRLLHGRPTSGDLLTCDDAECRAAVNAAVNAYRAPYDIGYRSVPTFLDVVLNDPSKTELEHGPDTGSYQLDASATWGPETGAERSFAGQCRPVAVGTVPASVSDVPGLLGDLASDRVTTAGGPWTTAVVAGFDASGSLLRQATRAVSTSTWDASLALVPGTTSVRTWCSSGEHAASGRATLPLAAMTVSTRVVGLAPGGSRLPAVALGTRFTVTATATLAGAPVPGLTLVLRQDLPGERGSVVVTDASGRATLTGTVGRVPGWTLVAAARPEAAGAPVPVPIVAPAAGSVVFGRLAARTYTRHTSRITVSGYLRATPVVPARFLAGHTVAFYLERPGHARIYVGRLPVTKDARFAGTLSVRYRGTLRAQLVDGDPYLRGRVLDRVVVR